MPLHDVTFEDVGFTSRKRDFSAEPGENAIAAFNADAPEGVSLVSISASPDDSVHEGGKDESGEYKVFVSVVVRREYDAGVDPADSDHAGDETFLTKADRKSVV